MSILKSGLLSIFWLTTSSICYAHEGHQPLPTKGVQVDTQNGYVTLSGQARSAIGLLSEEVVVGTVASKMNVYAESVTPWQAKAFGSAQIAPPILSHATSPHARQHGWRPSSGPQMVVGEQTGPSPRVWKHMSLVRRGFQLGLAPKHTKLDLREPKWP